MLKEKANPVQRKNKVCYKNKFLQETKKKVYRKAAFLKKERA